MMAAGEVLIMMAAGEVLSGEVLRPLASSHPRISPNAMWAQLRRNTVLLFAQSAPARPRWVVAASVVGWNAAAASDVVLLCA